MRTAVYDNPLSLQHVAPAGHPEHAGRYEAVRDALADLDGIEIRVCPDLDVTGPIARFHSPVHIDRVDAAHGQGGTVHLDPDTWVGPGSRDAARHSVAGACAAVDAVLAGEIDAAFLNARPPGHHAEPDRAMGFCLYNTIAIAALHALEADDIDRVAIVDIDVHHGNGTQCLAERDARVFFASLHQAPLYPGTGTAGETGLAGNVLNVPMPGGVSNTHWRRAFEAEVLPALRNFRPGFVFVSAGFDAHADDPLGGFALTDADYAWSAEQLGAIAMEFADSRLVSVMEGGYDCPALARSASAFVGALQRL